ncbi:hypothetical protein ACRAWF_03305 [Streptomyces sp. L7]
MAALVVHPEAGLRSGAGGDSGKSPGPGGGRAGAQYDSRVLAEQEHRAEDAGSRWGRSCWRRPWSGGHAVGAWNIWDLF